MPKPTKVIELTENETLALDFGVRNYRMLDDEINKYANAHATTAPLMERSPDRKEFVGAKPLKTDLDVDELDFFLHIVRYIGTQPDARAGSRGFGGWPGEFMRPMDRDEDPGTVQTLKKKLQDARGELVDPERKNGKPASKTPAKPAKPDKP